MMPESNGNGQVLAAGLNDHLPPQNLEAERLVLSALMMDQSEFETVLAILTPHDFYREAYQAVFRAMIDVHRAGLPPDAVHVAEELQLQSSTSRWAVSGSWRTSPAPHPMPPTSDSTLRSCDRNRSRNRQHR